MLRTLPLIMQDPFRHVQVLIASQHDPIRQIDILPIHEERLIQQANLIQRLMAKQHERTRQHLHLMRLLFIQIRQAITCECRRVRKQL